MLPQPIHTKRDGTITRGTEPIGRVVREVNGRWSPTELNGDYLGITDYRRQSDAAIAVYDNWLAKQPTRRQSV